MSTYDFILILEQMLANCWVIQEAEEVTQQADGRWFAFNISATDYIILEKKSLPTHLQALENCDIAVTLQSIVNDLQDLGEAWENNNHIMFICI